MIYSGDGKAENRFPQNYFTKSVTGSLPDLTVGGLSIRDKQKSITFIYRDILIKETVGYSS